MKNDQNISPLITLTIGLIGIATLTVSTPQGAIADDKAKNPAVGVESEYDPLNDPNLKKFGLDPTQVLKIVVNAEGVVHLDRNVTQLQDIPAKLDIFKQKKGVVWFYRGNPDTELAGTALEVGKMIFASGQAFIMFTKEDFSEVEQGGQRVKVKAH